MTGREQLYTRSIVRRLKKEIQLCPTNVIFLSPYLTSETAEIVINQSDSNTSIICTVLSIDNFASGGSSTVTIRRLLERGYSMFHLPNLHAKIVITDHAACIGSQNLTRGGTKNLEASIIISEKALIAHLKSDVMKWIAHASRITIEQIDDIERLLPSIRKFREQLRHTTEAATLSLKQLENERERAKEKLAKMKERRQSIEIFRNSRRIREAMRSSNIVPTTSLSATLREKTRHDYFGYYVDTYWTLSRDDIHSSYLLWQNPIDRSNITLQKRYRYVMLNLCNGALSWPALNKTQITKFGTSLQLSETTIIERNQYAVHIRFATENAELVKWNLEFTLSPWTFRSAKLTLHCYFSVQELVIIDHKVSVDRHEGRPSQNDVTWPRLTDPKFIARLTTLLTDPFKYELNSQGITAPEYLREFGFQFDVRLNILGNSQFLTIDTR